MYACLVCSSAMVWGSWMKLPEAHVDAKAFERSPKSDQNGIRASEAHFCSETFAKRSPNLMFRGIWMGYGWNIDGI